jgi:hypothetical protein
MLESIVIQELPNGACILLQFQTLGPLTMGRGQGTA